LFNLAEQNRKGITNKVIKKWCEEMEISEEEALVKWYLNVFALLKVKAIPNNNEYGFLQLSSDLKTNLGQFIF